MGCRSEVRGGEEWASGRVPQMSVPISAMNSPIWCLLQLCCWWCVTASCCLALKLMTAREVTFPCRCLFPNAVAAWLGASPAPAGWGKGSTSLFFFHFTWLVVVTSRPRCCSMFFWVINCIICLSFTEEIQCLSSQPINLVLLLLILL